MTIEIQSPHLKLSNKTYDIIKRKLLTLSHLSEKVSRAEIFLTTDSSSAGNHKVCKIRLDIFGDTLFVHKNADSFEEAAISAVKILKRRLKSRKKERNEPPDEATSTVQV